jgi:hypothetical protein
LSQQLVYVQMSHDVPPSGYGAAHIIASVVTSPPLSIVVPDELELLPEPLDEPPVSVPASGVFPVDDVVSHPC